MPISSIPTVLLHYKYHFVPPITTPVRVLYLLPIVIDKVAILIHSRPLLLSVKDIERPLAIKYMATVCTVRQRSASREPKLHAYLISNAFIQASCSSSESPKWIVPGKRRHMFLPSSMIGVRQYAHDTLVGRLYSVVLRSEA